MILKSKYNIGNSVWVFNLRTGKADEREIIGIRSQNIQGRECSFYAFMKDYIPETGESLFWIHETLVYSTKEELINRL